MDTYFSFKGQCVFVAGGSSGINYGIAQAFARCGANLAILSRTAEKVEAACERLQAEGVEVMGLVADVRDAVAVEAAFQQVQSQFGDIDILISGAAGNFPASVNDLSSNGFKSVMDIDLLGSFHVARAAYPYLKKPGASLIHISAPQAQVPMAMQAHVCAAKAGVDMLTRVLAVEWGAEGVRINSIIPGPIADTEGMARLAPSESAKALIEKSVPLKRLGRVEDVANAALFLSSPLASFISGAVLPVDGGWSLGGAAVVSAAMAANIRQGT